MSLLHPSQFGSVPEAQRDPTYIGKHRKPHERTNLPGAHPHEDDTDIDYYTTKSGHNIWADND